MKLLIDAGNTRLKWAWWDGDALSAVSARMNSALDFSALWAERHHVDAVWIASVASIAANSALASAVRAQCGRVSRFAATQAQACGVRIAYAEPGDLGVDRFLALIAAHGLAAAETVIATCGTALTLDALAADGTHLGGLIAAGPELAQDALRRGTARLGGVSAGQVVELADNSADGIESGTWLAAVALVERFLAHATRRLGKTPQLMLSGGGAAKLSSLLEVPHRVENDLVLRGLAQLADTAE